jgi:hypothetical protein
MWQKAQNEMAGFLPHAAMGPVERMVRHHYSQERVSGIIVSRDSTRELQELSLVLYN